jgi:hypothetical protein
MANLGNTQSGWRGACHETWWAQHREASLNWLALGLLLAAWNASDNDATLSEQRPQALRAYPYVSVRAAALHAPTLRGRSQIR